MAELHSATDERAAAQWYASGGVYEPETLRRISQLPADTRRACYQYGSLVSWQRLPQAARDVIAQRMAEVLAEGERLQALIDSGGL